VLAVALWNPGGGQRDVRPLTPKQEATLARWAERAAAGFGDSHPADARAYLVDSYARYQQVAQDGWSGGFGRGLFVVVLHGHFHFNPHPPRTSTATGEELVLIYGRPLSPDVPSGVTLQGSGANWSRLGRGVALDL
jgi:hypothetical protein